MESRSSILHYNLQCKSVQDISLHFIISKGTGSRSCILHSQSMQDNGLCLKGKVRHALRHFVSRSFFMNVIRTCRRFKPRVAYGRFGIALF